MSLALRLTFRNVGTTPVILDKRSTVITRHMVSRDLPASAAQQYEQEVRHSILGPKAVGFGIGVDSPDERHFVVIKPGESYEAESPRARVSLWIQDGTPDTSDALRAGAHLLQVRVATWYYMPDEAAELREKWSGKGFLWTKTLTSQPMPFKVDMNRPISRCPTTPSRD